MKKTLLRLLSVTLALLLLCGFGFTVIAEENDLVVLYTNDVHCAIDGYSVLAGYKADLESKGFKTVTVDAGDAIQGEVIGALTEGSAIVDIMNSVGYDFAVPGNHEFDYNTETFLKLATEEAEYEYICSNFVSLKDEKTIFKPYKIIEHNGEKIAFIGITTPETYSKSTPSYFQDENGNFIYGFSEKKFYETIQKTVDNALSEGAVKIIAVGHLGIEGTSDGLKSVDVIANTKGIDVLIDAHSHETINGTYYKNSEDKDVLLTSTGTKFKNFGKLVIKSDGSFETELITTDSVSTDTFGTEAKKAYTTVKEKIDDYNAEFEYLFEEIGISEVYLTQNDESGNRAVRNAETNLGNFVADAYRTFFNTDIAFVNGGGVRSEIQKGVVIRKAIMDINPWSNEMTVIEVSGQQILDALEYGVSAMPEEFGSFPNVSGISFEVHTYVESPVKINEMGDFLSIDENASRRVRNVKVRNEPIDESKMYSLAGSCYMLQLSGYKMFSDAKVIKTDNKVIADSEVLLAYFTETLKGTIPEAKYSNPKGDGRIIVVSEQLEEKPIVGDDFDVTAWISLVLISLSSAFIIVKKRI